MTRLFGSRWLWVIGLRPNLPHFAFFAASCPSRESYFRAIEGLLRSPPTPSPSLEREGLIDTTMLDFPRLPAIGRPRTAGFSVGHRPRQLVMGVCPILISSLDGDRDISRPARVCRDIPASYAGHARLLFPHGLSCGCAPASFAFRLGFRRKPASKLGVKHESF